MLHVAKVSSVHWIGHAQRSVIAWANFDDSWYSISACSGEFMTTSG